MGKTPTINIDKLPVLTDEQKAFLDANWDKMDIPTLTRQIFNDPKLDGRTLQGQAVKVYLAALGRKAETTKHIAKGPLELTEDQKTFIANNAAEMKPIEMVRALFPDDKRLNLLTREGRAVYNYFQEVNPHEPDFWEAPVEDKEYKYPPNIQSVVGLVNEYVSNPDPTRRMYHTEKLKPYEIKCLKALQGYLKTIRFRYQASQYDKKADRTLFESTFIRLTYEKYDLTQAEVDGYINAALEVVNSARQERKVLKIEEEATARLEGNYDSGDGEKKNLTQAFVDMLGQTQAKWDTSKGRYQTIINSLEGTRAKRAENRAQQHSSILNLFDAVQKDEVARADLAALGDKEKKEDADEVNRLSDMDAVQALIAGMTREEGAN